MAVKLHYYVCNHPKGLVQIALIIIMLFNNQYQKQCVQSKVVCRDIIFQKVGQYIQDTKKIEQRYKLINPKHIVPQRFAKVHNEILGNKGTSAHILKLTIAIMLRLN